MMEMEWKLGCCRQTGGSLLEELSLKLRNWVELMPSLHNPIAPNGTCQPCNCSAFEALECIYDSKVKKYLPMSREYQFKR